MCSETDRPPLPRTVLLMELLIRRLQLSAVPPFTRVGRGAHDARMVAELGAGLGVTAVALLLVAVMFRLPERFDHWAGARGSVAAAGCYFGMMAAAGAAGAFPQIAKKFLAIAAYAKRENGG